MGTDVKATREEVGAQVRGMIMHLKMSGIAKNHNSFAEAMDDLNMWGFVFDQAEVVATAYAFNRRLYNLIHDVGERQ